MAQEIDVKTSFATAAAATGPLSREELDELDAYWRASNYLSVGQIYLYDNPLLKEPLKREHIKPRLLGHWGTTPGLNFIYVHLNRVITKRRSRHDLRHRARARRTGAGRQGISRRHVQRGLSQHLAGRGRDEAAVQAVHLSRRHPQPRRPETPGSIHEGGELGYALSHAYGAAFDNPELVVACVVGDGEAETGPLATGWHSNKFLNPARDGCVLPILHLNGYKIANPCFLARIPRGRAAEAFRGLRLQAVLRRGRRSGAGAPADGRHARRSRSPRSSGSSSDARTERLSRTRPAWPMIVLRTPKGWTCPPRSTARSARTTGAATRCRWATWTSPSTSASSSSG